MRRLRSVWGAVTWQALTILTVTAVPLQAQQGGKKNPVPAHAPVDQAKVDAAIRKGIAYLNGRLGDARSREDELILWTFVHATVPESDSVFQRLFKRMEDGDLENTYNVALQAMILEKLDRVKHQGRIWKCAQFLVDNQCQNGQWTYGEPTPFTKDVPTGTPVKRDVATGSKDKARDFGKQEREKKPVRTMPVTRRRDGPASGDNSNSQYAALGLRACHDAGIEFPREVMERAMKWWHDSFGPDNAKDSKNNKVATAGGAAAGGWGYSSGTDSYGSMTAGAVGSLVIYHYILNEPWMKDQAIGGGLEWLARRFSVRENPGWETWEKWTVKGHIRTCCWLYYLYALERAGVLYGTERFGTHEWYPEGAKVLLETQAADGSWVAPCPIDAHGALADTCFAILFLRRATQPLKDVASVDRYAPKK